MRRDPRSRFGLVLAIAISQAVLSGCYRPNEALRQSAQKEVADFPTLFAENCSGCHGAKGRQGPAPPLNNPLRMAMHSQHDLETIISTGQGTLMPPMSQEHGGALTSNQVQIIAVEMKAAWSNPPPPIVPPARSAIGTNASAARIAAGAKLFAKQCADCHGDEGRGGDAGALNDPAFLALLSPQAIRSLIITGRPDLTNEPQMPSYFDLAQVTAENADSRWQEIDDICLYIQSWRNTNVSSATTTPAPIPASQSTSEAQP